MKLFFVVVGKGSLLTQDPADQIHAFMANEGICEFSTEPYKKPAPNNLKSFNMHISTYMSNKSSANYIHEPTTEAEIFQPNKSSKRTLTSVFETLKSLKVDVGSLRNSIVINCQGVI